MGREREPERAVGPFVCGIEFGASLLEVRYSRLVLGEVRWARVGIRGLRALIGVREQKAGGNELGTRRSLARMPPNDPLRPINWLCHASRVLSHARAEPSPDLRPPSFESPTQRRGA